MVSWYVEHLSQHAILHCTQMCTAHQYMDDTTHGVGRRNLHFRATFLSHDSCRFAWNRRSYLTLGQFFCEVAIERDPYTQHFEALLSCSASDQSVRHGDGCCQTVLYLRAPYRLTPVSLKTGCCQQFVPRSCHGLELNWRHRDDPAIVREKQQTHVTASHGHPHFCVGTYHKNLAAGVSRAAPKRPAAQGSPCGTTISPSFTIVSEFISDPGGNQHRRDPRC